MLQGGEGAAGGTSKIHQCLSDEHFCHSCLDFKKIDFMYDIFGLQSVEAS